MKTGIVLKIDGRKAILLKADGTFASVHAKSCWKVGETVSIPVFSRSRGTHIMAMAACLAMMVICGVGWNQLYTAPVALISLDVNPSIELSVNRFDRIVSATALNAEGSLILTEADIKNDVYREALADILNAEETNGYLTAEANVVFTVFASDPELQTSLLEELQGVADSKLSLLSGQIKTEYHAVDESTVNGAHGHGVTAGKYLYLQELQELAPDTDISKLTHHSIEQIKGEIKACEKRHGADRNMDKGSDGSGHGKGKDEAHHGPKHDGKNNR